jgi:hypothetical protein
MALLATLQFGDNNVGRYTREYLVTACKTSYATSYNQFRPDGIARCTRIEVAVIAPGRDDLNLYDWFVEQGSYSGRVVFDLSELAAGLQGGQRIMKFEDAQCFSLSESYDIDTHYRRQIILAFEAESVTVDDVEFKHL